MCKHCKRFKCFKRFKMNLNKNRGMEYFILKIVDIYPIRLPIFGMKFFLLTTVY